MKRVIKLKKEKEGFTIVELSISIVFISILSITVAIVINNAVSSYHRGLTLNMINTTGMDIVDDLRSAIQNSSTRSIEKLCDQLDDDAIKSTCSTYGGEAFVSATWNFKEPDGVTDNGRPAYGVFCTGRYSYVWNSGYYFEKNNGITLSSTNGWGGDEEGVDWQFPVYLVYKLKIDPSKKLTLPGDGSTKPFRLLKIKDDNRAVCKAAANAKYGSRELEKGKLDISEMTVLDEEPIEMLTNSGRGGVAVYDLKANDVVRSNYANSMFYSMSLILGTVQGGGINVNATKCAAPKDYSNENFDYCAINKFNFAAQAQEVNR